MIFIIHNIFRIILPIDQYFSEGLKPPTKLHFVFFFQAIITSWLVILSHTIIRNKKTKLHHTSLPMKPKNSHENHLTQPTPTSPSQVQQMISCSNQADGCGGGNPVDGYSHWSNWWKLGKTGWIFDQSLFLPARETSGCYGPCGF
jgi:hypothetical protein